MTDREVAQADSRNLNSPFAVARVNLFVTEKEAFHECIAGSPHTERFMSRKKRSAKLSVGEMRLMAVLWKTGPLKLSEAFHEQPGHVGYTTIQTQLNRLVDKGVVAKSDSRPTKYRAIVEPQAASSGMLEMLIDTVGNGSVIPVIELLVNRAPLDKDETNQLRRLISPAGSKSKPRSNKSPPKKAPARKPMMKRKIKR